MSRTLPARRRPSGQVVVIFAGAVLLLMMLTAVVVDVSWYWVNSLRVQRAADAAALAGAVLLPHDRPDAYDRAIKEATKNGYTTGAGTTVTPLTVDATPRRLSVTITAPVGTFFMRAIGITSIPATRVGRAEFTLPVPMGSPQNYYGVGLLNLPTPGNTGWRGGSINGTDWTTPANANATQDTSYALSPAAGALTFGNRDQEWTSFVPTSGAGSIPTASATVIDGIQLRTRAFLTGSGNSSTCQLQVRLSWDGGTTWTTNEDLTTPIPTARPANGVYQNLGGTADDWGHSWTRTQLDGTSFVVQYRYVRGTNTGCDASRTLNVDTIEVQVNYHGSPAPTPITAPDGTTLTPQNFWGAMQSQGAPSIQGDAYMTGYDTRKSVTNGTYDPAQYYNYEIDIPADGGQIWIFDPGFCDTGQSGGVNQGTGEDWTVGGSNGNSSVQPVSAQYNLFRDDAKTPYVYADDTFIGTSGTTFQRLSLSDPTLGGNSSAAGSCAGLAWHNGWWSTPSFQNLPAGQYRLHTTSRVFTGGDSRSLGNIAGGDNQTNSTGLNAFAIWAKAPGAVAPRVYGLGAMEAYFPLSPATASIFYLAQIEAVHADKWMDIDLWDPGDTGALPANLQILMPTAGGYQKAQFYYNTTRGTTIPTGFDCGPSTSGLVNSITTSTGSGGIYNGYWVRLCVHIDPNYTAPIPPGETEPGWWKIQYNMGGSPGDQSATDLTTWQVAIRGNPVHLVVP